MWKRKFVYLKYYAQGCQKSSRIDKLLKIDLFLAQLNRTHLLNEP